MTQFFLELWSEINQQPSLRARAADNPLLPQPTVQGELPCNTLFERLNLQYQKVVNRAEDMIVQQTCGEVEDALKVHFSAGTSSVDMFLLSCTDI